MRGFPVAVLLSSAALSVSLGCGSSNSMEADASSVPDLAPATPDLPPASSLADAWLSPALDGLTVSDVMLASDVVVAADAPSFPDLSSPDLISTGADLYAADLGGAASSGDAAAPVDAAFDPGPTVPIVVNSGNTATFNLGDGKWQRFSFPVEAGQIYAISELSGIERGYVSAQASVSPTNFTYQTDATTGRLIFTASTSGTYYIAVAVVGGGASGTFQVADGGRLLALGASNVTLAAPNSEDYFFFRFPAMNGKGYHLKVTGPMQPDVALAVSARAERSNSGQFGYSDFGVGGSLPFDEDITSAMVAQSISGFYYFYLNLHGDMTVTVTISELP
jgi:hypothetical protein